MARRHSVDMTMAAKTMTIMALPGSITTGQSEVLVRLKDQLILHRRRPTATRADSGVQVTSRHGHLALIPLVVPGTASHDMGEALPVQDARAARHVLGGEVVDELGQVVGVGGIVREVIVADAVVDDLAFAFLVVVFFVREVGGELAGGAGRVRVGDVVGDEDVAAVEPDA